jgi:hypothetical protein
MRAGNKMSKSLRRHRIAQLRRQLKDLLNPPAGAAEVGASEMQASPESSGALTWLLMRHRARRGRKD